MKKKFIQNQFSTTSTYAFRLCVCVCMGVDVDDPEQFSSQNKYRQIVSWNCAEKDTEIHYFISFLFVTIFSTCVWEWWKRETNKQTKKRI